MDKDKITFVINILRTIHLADFESMDKLVSLVYMLNEERKKLNEEKQDG